MFQRSIINRYIMKEILLSFVISFLFFFFIFFVNQLLVMVQKLLEKNASVKDVLLLVLYTMPSVTALSFPFGALVGALMSIGKLSFDNEILACLTSGISYKMIYGPMIFLGVMLFLVSFMIGDYLIPLGTIKYNQLFIDITHRNPELVTEPYSYKDYEDRVIINGNVSQETGIENLMIIDKDSSGQNRVIIANESRIQSNADQAGVLTLTLKDVFSVSADNHKRNEFDYFQSESMDYNILFRELTQTIQSLGAREMVSYDAYQEIKKMRGKLGERMNNHQTTLARAHYALMNEYSWLSESYETMEDIPSKIEKVRSLGYDWENLKNQKFSNQRLRNWEIEFYQKFSIPFSCLSFLILAFPLGLTGRRSGKAMGFTMGILISIIFWTMLMGARIYGFKNKEIDTALIMWLPNIFVMLCSAVLIPLRLKK